MHFIANEVHKTSKIFKSTHVANHRKPFLLYCYIQIRVLCVPEHKTRNVFNSLSGKVVVALSSFTS